MKSRLTYLKKAHHKVLKQIKQIFIKGWALFYLFNSFISPLPWTTCGNAWNSDCCTTNIQTSDNGSSFLVKPANCSENVTYPELEFWKRRSLQVHESPGIDDLGEMRWELIGLVFLAWVITFFCIFRGTKSTGKSVYVTSTFPLVMMIILIIRGVTLDGAMQGIEFYLKVVKPVKIDIFIILKTFHCSTGNTASHKRSFDGRKN